MSFPHANEDGTTRTHISVGIKNLNSKDMYELGFHSPRDEQQFLTLRKGGMALLKGAKDHRRLRNLGGVSLKSSLNIFIYLRLQPSYTTELC